MSRCLANDASLEGQYATLTDFIAALQLWISAERTARRYGSRLEVSRNISNLPVIGNQTVKLVINQHPNREVKRGLLRWFDLTGPFWDDAQMHPAGEYYEALGNVVTGTALGEIGALVELGEMAVPISLSPSTYSVGEIEILCLGRATGNWSCTVRNFISNQSFEEYLRTECASISSWEGLLHWAQHECPNLLLATNLIDQLPTTFYPNVAERSCVLLKALDELNAALVRGDHERFNELRRLWMEGAYARMTDSSETEKTDFGNEMTFRNPLTGQQRFCSWHAKIKTPQFRIHFDWPKTSPADPIFIGYMGPKIAKY